MFTAAHKPNEIRTGMGYSTFLQIANRDHLSFRETLAGSLERMLNRGALATLPAGKRVHCGEAWERVQRSAMWASGATDLV
jgi:hypothetical protein